MSEWMPVESHYVGEYPTADKDVIVYLKENKASAMGHLSLGEVEWRWWILGWEHSLPYHAVSHWMPMPKPEAPDKP